MCHHVGIPTRLLCMSDTKHSVNFFRASLLAPAWMKRKVNCFQLELGKLKLCCQFDCLSGQSELVWLNTTTCIFLSYYWDGELEVPAWLLDHCDEETGREEQSLPMFDLQSAVSSVVHGYVHTSSLLPWWWLEHSVEMSAKLFSKLKW